MALTVTTHQKYEDGSYLLILTDDQAVAHEFRWAPKDGGTDSDYEAMQLREARLLTEQAPPQEDVVAKVLKTQGTLLT
jgi:hypothetical protein